MTETMTPDISLIDESLNIKNFSNYNLNIQLSFNEFAYAIIDNTRNKYIALEEYKFRKINNYFALNTKLDEISEQFDWLAYKFNSIKVIYVNSKSTLIPVALYEEDEQETYFNFNHTLDANEDLCCDKLNNLNAYNIYSMPRKIKRKLSENLKDSLIKHHLTSLVESLLILNRNQSDNKQLYINVNTGLLDVVRIDDNKLIYNNTFKYQTPEDFIFHILYAVQQLKLNPETIEVVLSGEIKKDSEIYEKIFKYIRNISFIKKNEAFEYSYVFDELLPGKYFNLLNLNLIE